MRHPVETWLRAFSLDDFLHDCVLEVLLGLPRAVRDDVVNDPQFVLCDYEPATSKIVHVPLRFAPGLGPGRSVVLKRTLRRRPIEFVRWVIAHELAHAHLRNVGRSRGEDPEFAADALAAEWGFPKPGSSHLHKNASSQDGSSDGYISVRYSGKI
jgi:hypothetical protein